MHDRRGVRQALAHVGDARRVVLQPQRDAAGGFRGQQRRAEPGEGVEDAVARARELVDEMARQRDGIADVVILEGGGQRLSLRVRQQQEGARHG